ncbi:helix-turn-helix domain-containing protein [Minwuia sp.]|uniref:helix-turn-helix domain-containing protein n=1 Tax=Minwuia sp. TaxID=2493630 RepID=UPI003A8CD050
MNAFPQTLKAWRKARRFSQLELAMEADVSTRHLSFLETGRARPSPDMIGRLGDALQLPLAARNEMLTVAGFAAQYPAREWDAQAMAPVRAAVEHTLTAHSPYPAVAFDRLWRMVRMNRPAERLFGPLQIGEGDSLLDLLISDALPPLIENWPEVARHAARRLRTESAAQGGVPELDRVADVLARVPGAGQDDFGPVVPTIYRAGPLRLSLFATIAQFGTPEDLTLDDLKIEMYFPADEETEQALRAMAVAD